MTGRIWRRLSVVGLAAAIGIVGVVPGTTQQAQALTVADRIETVDTSTSTGPWSPNAPGPSGIAYRPENNTLIVVDGDKNAEGSTINLWEYSLTTETVVYSAELEVGDPLDDATGAAWDSANQVLYISTDGDPSGVYLFEPNGDDRFGGTDDGFIDVGTLITPFLPMGVTGPDVEDPAIDPNSGHLFVLNGNTSQIFEFDPVVGGFGDGDDVLVGTGFVVPPDTIDPPDEHPDDWEGLAYDPDTLNLLVGAKETDLDHSIYEVTTAGVFVERIDVTVIETELNDPADPPLIISGLTVQPAAGDELATYWIADRGVHTPSPAINDGRLHRIHRTQVVPPLGVPPVLGAIGNKSGNEGTLITFQATATDSFGDTLTFSLDAGGPSNDAITSNGLYTWTPTEAQGGAGPQSVTVRVTDAEGLSDPEPIQITANEVNQLPVVTPNPDVLRAEGESVSLQMFETDADLPAQPITWSALGLPAGLSINPSTGLISGTIGIGTTAGSPYNVTVRANDGIGFGQDVFVLSVTDTNRSPIMSAIGNKTVTQGSTLMFKANASDPDGDGFTFSLVSPPAGASISSAGNFAWTPSVAPGNYPVTVRVTDNGTPALTDQETITITVQAGNPNPDPVDPFTDDDGHVFENAIEWLAAEGITQGCNPPTNDRFCPNSNVTRGQMATFLVRALNLPTYSGPDRFVDDNGHIFEGAIERLAQAAITVGCNPPTNNRFCPDDNVTRGQMAAFLVRAFDLPAYSGPDRFVDDNGNVFEGAIERLAQAGITVGCNPPTNDRFCPGDNVTRGQMAAFLKRAMGG